MRNSPCVYLIKCPDTLLVRYVGMTHDHVTRFATHMGNTATDVGVWIQSIKAEGKQPIFEVVKNFNLKKLGLHSSNPTCDRVVRMSNFENYLIKKYLILKHPLFNKNGNIGYIRSTNKYRKA